MKGRGVVDCQLQARSEFAVRLQELASLTWGEIQQAPRTGLGHETIDQGNLKHPLPGHITPDQRILAFRFGSAGRFVGYRDDEKLRIFGIHPAHDAY